MDEIGTFLSMLCRVETHGNVVYFLRCRTNEEKRTVLNELLRHADEDEMSPEDREICRTALERVQETRCA